MKLHNCPPIAHAVQTDTTRTEQRTPKATLLLTRIVLHELCDGTSLLHPKLEANLNERGLTDLLATL
jgi:hypothetical protein